MTKWLFHRQLDSAVTAQSLRTLLSDEWLLPKYLIRQLRINQRVLVNHQYHPVNTIVHAGDQIQLEFVTSDFTHLPPHPPITVDPAGTVEVVYEDHDLLIVNKHRGEKTHPNQPGELGSTLNFAANYLASKGEAPYMVHRLDMETSGALIIAKNPPVAVPILNRQISNKIIERTYLTWVHGVGLPKSGTIDLPIGRDPEDKRKRKVNGINAQSALTHYQVLKEQAGNSLLQVNLKTGRTHQIRVHLAASGHSLIGDPPLYSNDNIEQPMLLHSWQVVFPLLFSHQWQTVMAPVPKGFEPSS
ncbi:RluA family pseudouridine synthase [Lentilactobacillus senioris]|uniref:RluA family pseudouridine synthase n=1 Tax=Lentilactobacillus senioris TaxID=931534 RepID=UPI0006D00ED4|nr:RluA family pseudouridine synthase [Lentilactobacillus senioris]